MKRFPFLALAAVAAVAPLPPRAAAQLERLLAPAIEQPAAVAAAAPGGRAAATVAPPAARKTLTVDMLTAELEKELTARLGLSGELKLALAHSWQLISLPAEDFALVISEPPLGGISGTFLVRVKGMSGGTIIGEWQLALRAQLFEPVWVASTRLDRGQILDRTMLAVQKINVLRERQPVISAETDPASLELTQTVAAGRPLTKRDVAGRAVVRKGQMVEVVAQQGLLAVTMKALALESGATGDLIKLRNVESRREFSGQILNETRVQVQF